MIPPGRAGKIRANVATERYRGAVAKGITVTTNDPARSTVQLTVKMTIAGSVNLLPGQVLTVGNMRGKAAPGRLVVRKDETETGTLRVDNLRVSAPWLEVAAREVGPEGPGGAIEGVPDVKPGDWILEVAVAGDPPDGQRSLTLTFDTGLPREPTVSVPVQVLWRPAIRFSAPTVVLNLSGEPPPLVVSFRSDVSATEAIVSAEPAGLEARLEPANAQAMHVRLRWTGTAAPPPEGRVFVRSGTETASAIVRFALAPAPTTSSR